MPKVDGTSKLKFDPEYDLHEQDDIEAVFQFTNSKYLELVLICKCYNGNF